MLADLRKGIKCLPNVDGEDEDGDVFLERHFVGHGRMVERQSWDTFTFWQNQQKLEYALCTLVRFYI